MSTLRNRKLDNGETFPDTSDQPQSQTVAATAADTAAHRPPSRVLMVLRLIVSTILFSMAASYLVTDTMWWTYKSNLTNYRNYIPRTQVALSVQQLRQYDGSEKARPIYLSIGGVVYDVSAGAHWYGPGGSYHIFGGRVTDRAFATNCLSQDDQLTQDLRGLDASELENLNGWISFFKHHQVYFKVGTLVGPSYDPTTPPPPKCEKPKPRPK
ncbi:Membrane-associated progesterone receptor component 2 [Smittium mucronatum]|uniref:Membrane-associated progesterone receptor component 2 n=1 Tax=Smittium mucronatum TaxID=133383 RepID=A0A1R0GPA8_9FUNG|nr:Membrane-associated progesterone receptor component 2 [Smittium mucronatum]